MFERRRNKIRNKNKKKIKKIKKLKMSKEQVEKFRSGQIMNGKFIGFETITSNPQDVVNKQFGSLL